MTDFRTRGTIMGPTGLTAVFGMGTGVAPPVWSPETRPACGQARRPSAGNRGVSGHAGTGLPGPGAGRRKGSSREGRGRVPRVPRSWRPGRIRTAPPGCRHGVQTRETSHFWSPPPAGRRPRRAAGRGGQAIGCWDWSAAAVARRALPAHRPGRLPGAFIACANGNLVLKRASRLDAFSAYPFPTWLPGGALSRTAGTPEVGPPQSSRTRGDPSQVSCAHGR